MKTRPMTYCLGLLSLCSIALASQQRPLAVPLPPSPPAQPSAGLHTLADLLTMERRGTIFYDYARDSVDITTRLSSSLFQSSIFVPANAAVIALPRKPHQAISSDIDLTIEQSDASQATLIESWLSAHIISESIDLSPSTSSPISFATLLSGHNVTLERSPTPSSGEKVGEDIEKWRIQPGNIEVLSIKKASNGVLLLIDGVLGGQE